MTTLIYLTMIRNKNFAVTIYMTILYNYGDIDRNQIISLNNTNSRVEFHKKFKSRNKVKLNLKHRIIFGSHQSGWRYAIDSLEPMRDDINGFFVDDFIERTFSWGRPMVGLKKSIWAKKFGISNTMIFVNILRLKISE